MLLLDFFLCTMQVSNYEKELEEMKHMTRQEYIAYLRRYIHMFELYNIDFVL